MIGFFVLSRLSAISLSRYLVFVIGVLWTIPLCEREKREIWAGSYQRKDALGWLIDFPLPYLPWPPFPLYPLTVQPSFPLQ